MQKGVCKCNEKHWNIESRKQYSLGDLDFVNLRLNPSSDLEETPRSEIFKKGSRDQEQKYHRQIKRRDIGYIRPDPRRNPQGYENRPNKKSPRGVSSEDVLLLYTKDSNKKVFTTGPINQDDFLYPSKKKSRPKTFNNGSGEQIDRNYFSNSETLGSQNDFPFKITPSGKLKVESSQVVFSSKKLSVLVADPTNTKVNISPETINFIPFEKMNRQESVEAVKGEQQLPVTALMNQANGFSSLGSIIANSPVRCPAKEGSDYETKQTSEILDPELNLGRLGYSREDAVCWDKVKLPEKKNLYLELYHRVTNNTNADCKVYIDNEEFNCHLIVLQCYSELFDAYVAVKKVELPADRCSASAFAFIYEWMITGEPSYISLTRQNVLDIFISAKYLKIKDLMEQCWSFIDNVDVFYEDSAFLLYMDAKAKNLPEVQEVMLPRIKKFFLMLVSSLDWLELDVEDVKNMLKSNYVAVNCEMEIFMAAVRWLKHDYQNRDNYKYEVLDCVRFGNIAPWQLVDIKRNPENPDFLELTKDIRICKMIDDGLAFVIIKYWYGQENEDFQHWNTILGLQEPPARNWNGPDKTYFTYREFLIYLDQYRRNQLIEKNKPRLTEKGDKRLKEDKSVPERNSLTFPGMDEFISKKKHGAPKKLNKL